jgi:hypothetical protein
MYLVAGFWDYDIWLWYTDMACGVWMVYGLYSLGAISELCCRISGGKTWDMELRVGAQKYIDRWGKGHDWAWA